MDHNLFIVLWYSNGLGIWYHSKSTGRKFLKELSKDGKSIFKEMKENYQKYLIGILLKVFLSSNTSQEDKIKLLSKAMGLYYGKFHIIWMRIVGLFLKSLMI
jgi:hypothetical protein